MLKVNIIELVLLGFCLIWSSRSVPCGISTCEGIYAGQPDWTDLTVASNAMLADEYDHHMSHPHLFQALLAKTRRRKIKDSGLTLRHCPRIPDGAVIISTQQQCYNGMIFYIIFYWYNGGYYYEYVNSGVSCGRSSSCTLNFSQVGSAVKDGKSDFVDAVSARVLCGYFTTDIVEFNRCTGQNFTGHETNHLPNGFFKCFIPDSFELRDE